MLTPFIQDSKRKGKKKNQQINGVHMPCMYSGVGNTVILQSFQCRKDDMLPSRDRQRRSKKDLNISICQ